MHCVHIVDFDVLSIVEFIVVTTTLGGPVKGVRVLVIVCKFVVVCTLLTMLEQLN